MIDLFFVIFVFCVFFKFLLNYLDIEIEKAIH